MTQPLPPLRLLAPAALLLLVSCGGSDVVSSTGGTITVSVSPATVTLAPGGSQLFAAAVTGTRNTGVTWTVLGGTSSGAFQGLTGVYTAPTLPGTYTVVATSSESPAVAGTATVTVSGSTGLSLSPSSAVISLGRSLQLSAFSTDPTPIPVAVTWSVNSGGAGGNISTQGIYTAPPTLGVSTSSQIDVITATLAANSSVSATVPILVSPVVIDPDRTGVRPGGSITFTAQPAAGVTGGVTWTAQYFATATATPLDVSPAISANSGSTPPSATFTAPAYTSGFYKVRATSISYPATYGESVITIQ